MELGEELLAGAQLPPVSLHEFVQLGAVDDAPRLVFARPADYLVELGLGPGLGLAAGALGRGDRWQLAPSSWEWLHGARYYARALERESLALLGAWTFEKRAAARRDPECLVPAVRGEVPRADAQVA